MLQKKMFDHANVVYRKYNSTGNIITLNLKSLLHNDFLIDKLKIK